MGIGGSRLEQIWQTQTLPPFQVDRCSAWRSPPALAMRPRVLVLDEPTASLDGPGTTSVINALARLRQEYGLTIVLMEHRLAEVRRLADRVMVLDEGRVVAEGSFETMLGDYDTFATVMACAVRRKTP